MEYIGFAAKGKIVSRKFCIFRKCFFPKFRFNLFRKKFRTAKKGNIFASIHHKRQNTTSTLMVFAKFYFVFAIFAPLILAKKCKISQRNLRNTNEIFWFFRENILFTVNPRNTFSENLNKLLTFNNFKFVRYLLKQCTACTVHIAQVRH